MLAVTYSLEKCRYFILGCKLLIVGTDHKPLIPVYGDRALHNIKNTFLFNLKMATLRYTFKMVHILGWQNMVPDATSITPMGMVPPEPMFLPDDITTIEGQMRHMAELRHDFLAIIMMDDTDGSTSLEEDSRAAAQCSLNGDDLRAITWDRVRITTSSHRMSQHLIEQIEEGFPENSLEMAADLREFHHLKYDLYTMDGVVMFGDRIVMPPGLHKEAVDTLHGAQQGVSMMTSWARLTMYWPGIMEAIKLARDHCDYCNIIAPSQPSPPPNAASIELSYPFQCICANYYSFKGKNYLVVVDRYSGWPAAYCQDGKSDALIAMLKDIVHHVWNTGGTGIRRGPPVHGVVHHCRSFIGFPHSSCRAEISVKTTKCMLKYNTGPDGELDTDRFQRAMLMYRNTRDPATGTSLVLAIFSQEIEDFIPVPAGLYRPSDTWSDLRSNMETAF